MPLTPQDFYNKEFGRSFRGYRVDEVDGFLDQVVRDYENLIKENAALKEAAENLTVKLEHYRGIEETLNNALVLAQRTAEEVQANAKERAAVIIKEAEMQAQAIIEEARAKVRELAREYGELKKEMEIFRTRMRTLIQGCLEMLEQDYGGDEAALGRE